MHPEHAGQSPCLSWPRWGDEPVALDRGLSRDGAFSFSDLLVDADEAAAGVVGRYW
jgi:hypothetical protein